MTTIPSREDLLNVVARSVSEQSLRDAVVYVFKKLLTPEDSNQFGRHKISVSHPSVLLFIDLVPMANWSHDCLYMVYDGQETSIVKGNFPPDGADLLLLKKPASLEDWVLLNSQSYQ
jgi:hypothetical protein